MSLASSRSQTVARKVGLIHFSVTFDNHAINRTDFVRKHSKDVSDNNVTELYVSYTSPSSSMRDLRHSSGERIED